MTTPAPWLQPAWWTARLPNQISPLLPTHATVQAVVPYPNPIVQLHTKLTAVTIHLDDGTHHRFRVKQVLPQESYFRSPAHRAQTIASFVAEATFYTSAAPRLFHDQGEDEPRPRPAIVPRPFVVEAEANDTWTIVLGDLDAEGSTGSPPSPMDVDHARDCLSLLARLHGLDLPLPPQRGSYWSLEKRQTALAGVADAWANLCSTFQDTAPDLVGDPEFVAAGRRLQAVAVDLDQMLLTSPHVWIHGDFKAANLFVPTSRKKHGTTR